MFAGSGQVEYSGSGTISALNDTVTVSIPTSSSLVFHITGTWSATLAFEASVDGTNFFAIPATAVATGSQVTTTSTTGAYLIGVGGYSTARVIASTHSSGSAAVSWSADNTPNIQSTVQQGNAPWLIRIQGATTSTNIGNVSDRLKVDSVTSTSSDNSNLDAFGRLRVSNPETIFDTAFRWDKQPVTWSESTASGGTVTHDANKVSVVLACTTTTNSSAIFQSRQYVKYHPAKSQLILITGNFIETATNVTKRFGYFDANNGVYFQLSGSTLSVVRRTSVSGSVVDNTTTQGSWNIDPMNGSGPSGVTLDITKQQIFVIDFQWLGSGRIRYGFMVGGKMIYCHEDNSANVLTVPWSQSGDAPIRAEITNSGSTSSSMHITCCSVICENFFGPEGITRSINNGTTARSYGLLFSTIPMVSLRKQSAYLSVPIQIIDAGIFASSADDFFWRIILNGTLTGASWTDVDGVCQADVSATAITGGTTLWSSYVRGGSSAPSSDIATAFQDAINRVLGSDLAGNSDVLSVVGSNLSATATAYAFINYREMI